MNLLEYKCKAVKNNKGFHVWDKAQNFIETPFGQLVFWKEGTLGGFSEAYYAKLYTKEELESFVLTGIAGDFGLRNGDVFTSSEMPTKEDGTDSVVYNWTYFPSTE